MHDTGVAKVTPYNVKFADLSALYGGKEMESMCCVERNRKVSVYGENTGRWWAHDVLNSRYIELPEDVQNMLEDYEFPDEQYSVLQTILDDEPEWLNDKYAIYDALDFVI